jgi:hypothetical protein
VAFGLLKIVPTTDGGVQMIRTDRVGGAQASPGAPMASGAPAGAPSPYAPTPALPGAVGGVPGPRPMRELNEEVQQLSRSVGDKKIPVLDESMSALDAIFNKYKVGEMPGVGFGMTGSKAGDVVFGAGSALGNQYSKEAQENRNALKRWSNMITRASAGLAQTVQETANVMAETMTKAGASEQDLRNAYDNWKKAYMNERSTAFAGADPQVVSEFYKRKGQKALFYAPSEQEAESLAKSIEARGIKNFEVRVSARPGQAAGGKVTPAPGLPAAADIDAELKRRGL